MDNNEKPKEEVLVGAVFKHCKYHGRTEFLVDYTSRGVEVTCIKCLKEFVEGFKDETRS